jgi:acylphosphatase
MKTERESKTAVRYAEEEAPSGQCRLYRVEGRVQGVWFRESTRREAEPLGITGYARNMGDGSVEVLACGQPGALDRLDQWLRQGPPMARVDQVGWIETAKECPQSFVIL